LIPWKKERGRTRKNGFRNRIPKDLLCTVKFKKTKHFEKKGKEERKERKGKKRKERKKGKKGKKEDNKEDTLSYSSIFFIP